MFVYIHVRVLGGVCVGSGGGSWGLLHRQVNSRSKRPSIERWIDEWMYMADKYSTSTRINTGLGLWKVRYFPFD